MQSQQDIQASLKFIGRIKIGEKINTRGPFMQPDHVITSLSRTFWHQDSRVNAYNYITDTVRKAFEIVARYAKVTQLSETEKLTMKNILLDLAQAKTGIFNLGETYAKDEKFKCDIQTLLQSIDASMAPYARMIEQFERDYPSLPSQFPSNLGAINNTNTTNTTTNTTSDQPSQDISTTTQPSSQVDTLPATASQVNISVSARQGPIDIQSNIPQTNMIHSSTQYTPVMHPVPTPSAIKLIHSTESVDNQTF